MGRGQLAHSALLPFDARRVRPRKENRWRTRRNRSGGFGVRDSAPDFTLPGTEMRRGRGGPKRTYRFRITAGKKSCGRFTRRRSPPSEPFRCRDTRRTSPRSRGAQLPGRSGHLGGRTFGTTDDPELHRSILKDALLVLTPRANREGLKSGSTNRPPGQWFHTCDPIFPIRFGPGIPGSLAKQGDPSCRRTPPLCAFPRASLVTTERCRPPKLPPRRRRRNSSSRSWDKSRSKIVRSIPVRLLKPRIIRGSEARRLMRDFRWIEMKFVAGSSGPNAVMPIAQDYARTEQ